MTIEAASPMDEPWIRQLLILCGLPQEDITPQHLRHFWVIREKGEAIGVVGLEIFGRLALLRSLAVDPQCRKEGYGSRLIKKGEEYAASLKIEEVYLLTVTAEREGFFAKRGYRKIGRNSAPPAIQGTAEFQGLCPVSSVCMVKQLQGRKI
jgi:amino-acid N-acetyltransferase